MQNMIDIRQLLKKYHSFIYTGNERTDLDLMQTELRDLYDNHLISVQTYQTAILIIRKRLSEL